MNLLYPGRSYVLKHLLSRYYASDDSAEIELGIAAVKALDLSPVFGHKTNEPTDFRLARFALRGGPDGSRGSTGTSQVTFLPRHIAQNFLSRIEDSQRE